MDIKIDYLSYAEQVNITHDASDKVLWRTFYSVLCDYLPAAIISYSEYSMSFPWRYFLAVKGNIKLFIKAHRDQIKLLFSPAAREMLNNSNNATYAMSIQLPKRTKEDIDTKLRDVGFIRRLTENQINNLVKISQLPGAATFSVPGAGKTTEALAYYFINSEINDKLLVVAPKNAFGAWDEQLASCMGQNETEHFTRLRGGEVAIQATLKQKPKFMIITYDQLTRVKESIITSLSDGNVFMFLDESHRIKGGKLVKRADAILDMAHLPKRKLVMSGTPMPQSPKDLLPQFAFLYPTKEVDENSVIDYVQPIYVRTTKGQLGIPEVNHIVYTVNMPPLQREIYTTLKSEVRRQINPVLSDSSKYELRKLGKCVMKMMEFVSNPSLLANDMDYVFDRRVGSLLLTMDGPKIDYVCKRARQLAADEKKVIIWSCFVQNVELIALRLRDLGSEYIHGKIDAGDENDIDTREGKIKRFHEDRNCMVLVANPAACSEGISLHEVCQNAIYLDRSFNAAHYLQSEDRIHRLGLASDAHPTVEFVECKDSIDQVIRQRLTHKVDVMAMALNDTSLRVAPSEFDFDDESEIENEDSITLDDAQTVLDYFFGGGYDA